MKIGDLVRDDDGGFGVVVELDDAVSERWVVYYGALRSIMGEEEKYLFMYEDQVKVICEAG
jgi:hypothetical protein